MTSAPSPSGSRPAIQATEGRHDCSDTMGLLVNRKIKACHKSHSTRSEMPRSLQTAEWQCSRSGQRSQTWTIGLVFLTIPTEVLMGFVSRQTVSLLLIHRSKRSSQDKTRQCALSHQHTQFPWHFNSTPPLHFLILSFVFPLTWWLPLFYRPNCPWGGSVVVVSLVFVIKKSLVLNSQASYFPGVLSYSLEMEATQWL